MASDKQRDREPYHHGNLRETLIQAAMAMIAERGLAGFAIAELARAVGVSPAAPYRHFRDRNAVVAEVAKRGFEQLAADLDAARRGKSHPGAALEACAQAHLAFAGRDMAVYATMFDPSFPSGEYDEVVQSRDAAFGVLRKAVEGAVAFSSPPEHPPVHMVALHIWSMTHGIANLFVNANDSGRLPMAPEDLLEAGVLIYLRSLRLT